MATWDTKVGVTVAVPVGVASLAMLETLLLP